MKKTKVKNEKMSNIIMKKYVPAILFILLVIIIRQSIIQFEINQYQDLSKVVTTAAKQRTLSQMISKDAHALYLTEDENTVTWYLEQLKTSIRIWKISYDDLKKGNPEAGMPGNNSAKIMKLFDQTDSHHQVILNAAKDVIKLVESGEYGQNEYLKKLKIIDRNEDDFLDGMDEITLQYDQEANHRIERIGHVEVVLFLLILAVIIFEVIFIFLPVEKKLSKAFKEIEESNDSILKLFKIAHGAMFVIDQETTQIIIANEQAEKIMDSKDKDISSIYFNEVVQFKSAKYADMMETIKINEKNENLDLVMSIYDQKNMDTLLTSVKLTFQERPAILIGLFDITIRKQAEETLKNLAITDELTGLYNRHYLDEVVKGEMELADRYKDSISMMILDLDHFKRVNDNWGHPVGDDVLKNTAEIANNLLRKSDGLFRLGGEEFLVVMPKTNAQGALVLAEKMREGLLKNPHPIVGRITVSIGIAEKLIGESYEDWYKRADKALYLAKEKGRNRVISYDGQEGASLPVVQIEWKNEWDSGNKEIDVQHQDMIEYVNHLIIALQSVQEDDIIMQEIDKLLQCIVNHFSYEEQVMTQVGFPEVQRHSIIHKNLVVKAFHMKESQLNGELKSSGVLSFVVDDVIMGHMQEEDVKFYPYIKIDASKQEIDGS